MAAPTLWVVQLNATAGPGAGYPAGVRHALMAFVAAATREAGEAAAVEGAGRSGWTDVEMLKSSRARKDAELPKGMQPAAAAARRDGFCLVVYPGGI